VSGSNAAVVSALSASINVQGTRPGISYAAWANGNPLLADPDGDADLDGTANKIEYGAGTSGLNPASYPSSSLTIQDLTGLGYSNDELVFGFDVASNTDDLTLWPVTSTDLRTWNFDPLEFVDSQSIGGSMMHLRFRLPNPPEPRRFFRTEAP
jgi:hypothetical protein